MVGSQGRGGISQEEEDDLLLPQDFSSEEQEVGSSSEEEQEVDDVEDVTGPHPQPFDLAFNSKSL